MVESEKVRFFPFNDLLKSSTAFVILYQYSAINSYAEKKIS